MHEMYDNIMLQILMMISMFIENIQFHCIFRHAYNMLWLDFVLSIFFSCGPSPYIFPYD